MDVNVVLGKTCYDSELDLTESIWKNLRISGILQFNKTEDFTSLIGEQIDDKYHITLYEQSNKIEIYAKEDIEIGCILLYKENKIFDSVLDIIKIYAILHHPIKIKKNNTMFFYYSSNDKVCNILKEYSEIHRLGD